MSDCVLSGDEPGHIVSTSKTDGELYRHSLSRELEELTTPKRSLDSKILWMDGTMTLGRPRHKVQKHDDGDTSGRLISFTLFIKRVRTWISLVIWHKTPIFHIPSS